MNAHAPIAVPLDFVPQDADDWRRCLADPMWRLCSGQLYWIMIKEDVGEGTRVRFKPNRAQVRLIRTLHNRNLILKARQLGFSTLIAIMWLDHALFVADQRVGIVAQDLEAAKKIFRDKVVFAYNNLPAPIRDAMPVEKKTADEILFAHNNSAIQVATSMRSGTIHRLHVSEMGKIGAKYPEKADEVVTGSLPAVPKNGIAVIESTAEGQSGHFYEMCKLAKSLSDAGKPLTALDYRLHFFPWWQNPEYNMAPEGVPISAKDHQYFQTVEGEMGCTITMRQRAWYIATRDGLFAGNPEKMWQEYPSTPDEPFLVSTEGTYYAVQLAAARIQGRICRLPVLDGVPVNTFWDIGNSDGTGIWFHQKVGPEHRFLKYLEGWGEPYSYYIKQMQALGWLWGRHFLPHDAQHERQQGKVIAAPVDELRDLAPGWKFVIVPRVHELQHGIQLVRDIFGQCWFDAEGCKEGLVHLSRYRKEWNARVGGWKDSPVKDEHTEAADSFRQFPQGWSEPTVAAGATIRRTRKGGMVV